MTVSSDPPRPRPIADRTKDLLLRPLGEWCRISEEGVPGAPHPWRYAAALAAIGPLCFAVGGLLFPFGLGPVVQHPHLTRIIADPVFGYGLALLNVFLLALFVDALAPRFGGARDRRQAGKLVIYSWTPVWLSGVAGLAGYKYSFWVSGAAGAAGYLWAYAPRTLAAAYGAYLFYVGAPLMIKADKAKMAQFTAAVLAAGVALAWVDLELFKHVPWGGDVDTVINPDGNYRP